MISIGIDAGKKKCVAALKRDSKEILEHITFQNRTKGIMELVERVKSYGEEAVAVVESTANYWIRIHDMLEENGISTLLANPIETKAIAKARIKDDKIDSNILADLLRADLIPESFVPDREDRELRQLVRTRIDLVTSRTMSRNKVHAILSKYELDAPDDLFTKKGTEWLRSLTHTDAISWIDRMQLNALLDILESLDRQIAVFTAKIASISMDDERVKLLMTIPGVDYFTALTVVSEIADIKRFITPWKLVAYAGLAPSQRDSGDRRRRGRITKKGSRWLRFALVEAANIARIHDERLKSFHDRIASRRGFQKANVATAKEMLVIMWHMLMNNEPYRTMNKEMVERKYKRMKYVSGLG
ncbi:MAG: IS110 family transposase [Nitrososphaerales archaeon]